MEIDEVECQLSCQFSRLATEQSQLQYTSSSACQCRHNNEHQQVNIAQSIDQFDYGLNNRLTDSIDLVIDDVTLSSPQLFISGANSDSFSMQPFAQDDVIATCRVTNRCLSTGSRSGLGGSSPPGCHLRCRRGRALALGPERLLLPPLLPGLSAVCQLRLQAPATAPTGWHRVELQLYTPLGGPVPGDGARRSFEVYVAPATPAATTTAAAAKHNQAEEFAMTDL
ncbi:hypothetical protein BOX15_Mlig027447g1 [Macrostomum lignano]|uniref:Uncharacterized protein n=1 Tax=Macrostomum lignano TaxID=282301 RepID=A0A267F389_9PLAT|nr:hypothetical protein BOX15_Mlig027447g1 [Macrostomum lignano]